MSSMEKEIRRYLIDHPDFFKHHIDIFTKVVFPHSNQKGDDSHAIYGHHVKLLRAQNEQLQKQNQELTDLLEYNYNRLLSLRTFFEGLLFEKSDQSALERLCQHAKKIDVHVFQLLVFNASLNKKLASIGANVCCVDRKSELYKALKTQKVWERVLMGNHQSTDNVFHLLSNTSSGLAFKSYALIGIGKTGSRLGDVCLFLGHEDADKFSPNMNDVLLKYIGIVVSLMLRVQVAN